MSDIKTKVKELYSQFQEIEVSLDLPQKREELRVLELAAAKEKLWDNPDEARKTLQKLGDLKKEIDEVDTLSGEIKTLNELAQENQIPEEKDVKKLEKRVNQFMLISFLSDPYDKKDAIISIHAGQGGTEAMDWVSMLYRMYLRYAEKKNWGVETVDVSEGEEAGIKSISFKVKGPYAYGYLKGEAGTHRLVRQSPFNADKLRQTSFALVEVLPELEEIDLPDIKIKDEDVEWQFFRASSQGGQNVQKVSTAVRLTHKPTGIVVSAQTERYQEQNRKTAMNLLRAKLWIREKEKAKKKEEGLKGEYRPASWGNQIRNYVLHPYKMVKDTRTEVETADAEGVLDGEIDDFVNAELQLTAKE